MYYSNNGPDQSFQVVNDTNFDGTYILTNLSPYTIYSVYVTAVRLIGGDNDTPLEGMKSKVLTTRTLAGGGTINNVAVVCLFLTVPAIKYDNKSKIILNAESSTTDETFTIDLPAITIQRGLFR